MAHYGASVGLFVTCVLILLLCFGISRLITKRTLNAANVVNALGTLLMFLYLPITLLSIAPFECMQNPGNSYLTLRKYRSVVCWHDQEHSGMVALSVMSFLAFPVLLLAIAIHATVLYPRRVGRCGCHWWLQRYDFLLLPQFCCPQSHQDATLHMRGCPIMSRRLS